MATNYDPGQTVESDCCGADVVTDEGWEWEYDPEEAEAMGR